MELLPINEKKSREAAEKILEEYRTQHGFANAPINPRLTSAWGDGTATSTVVRQQYPQARLERQQAGKRFCEWCDRCINSLPKQAHRDLLRARYCDGPESEHPDQTAIDTIEVSAATYSRRKADALLAAAFYFGVETDEIDMSEH